MNEKREVILPSDFSGEKGKIVCYRISSYLELLYIDIRSRRIPEVQIQAYEGEAVMTVNFSFLGKCEVLLKNGGGTYVDTGEYSIDYGTASREADEFYYPRAQYHGMELILYPCPELDKELSLNGRNTKMSVELKERFLGRETPFISKADARIEQAVRVIQDDIEADADMNLLAVDVSRWLQVLCSKRDAVETNRVYYSGSQIQIVRKTMDILTEDLSKRYSAATQSRFAKAFKNYYGAAPLEYKRKHNLNKDSRQMELSDNK